MSRRQFVVSATAAAMVTSARAESPVTHVTLRAGDLTAAIGGNAAHEQHRAGYNGVWSLRHAKGARSVFVPAVAGLNLEHIVTGEHLEDSRIFYGHFDDLVWIVMFDRSEGIRFTHSPSGGGANAERKTTNPAWDFQFLIEKPEVMKDYGFKVRTVLRPKCSRDDILAEFNRWKPQP